MLLLLLLLLLLLVLVPVLVLLSVVVAVSVAVAVAAAAVVAAAAAAGVVVMAVFASLLPLSHHPKAAETGTSCAQTTNLGPGMSDRKGPRSCLPSTTFTWEHI